MVDKSREFCLLGLLLAYFTLFISGIVCYEGSITYYMLFSLSFFLLLVSSLYRVTSYGYLFLSIFLWLGFWLKFTVHIVFNYSFLESTGSFLPSPDSYDKVLLISTVGCWGVIISSNLLHFLGFKSTVAFGSLEKTRIPVFYLRYRKILIPLLFLAAIAMALMNAFLGVFQVGLVPAIILPFKLNAAISWLMSIGFALMISTVLWWEIQQRNEVMKFISYSLVEPLFSSLSILSRGLYIFHFVPVCFALFLNREKIGRITNRQIICVLVVSAALFLVSLQGVTWARNYYYSGVAPEFVSLMHKKAKAKRLASKIGFISLEADKDSLDGKAKAKRLASKIGFTSLEADKHSLDDGEFPVFVKVLTTLIIERWLGIEGVMAVWSYPEKSLSLLKQGLIEKAEVNKIGMYQKMVKSQYEDIDTSRYIFASLPGSIGFFYFSGSLILVFLGMSVLTCLMMVGERLIFIITNNILLCSLIGIDIANTIAQFGVAPSMMIKHYLLIFAYCLFIFIIQSKKLPGFNVRLPFSFPTSG